MTTSALRPASRRRPPERPLLARRAALPTLGGAVLAAAVCGFLGRRYADTSAPGRLDSAVDGRVRTDLAPSRRLLSLLVHLGDPLVVTALTAVLVVACLRLGRPRAALLTAGSVPLAGGITEYVLKPLVGRTLGHGSLHHGLAAGGRLRDLSFSFPSGHTAGVFALGTCLVLVLLGSRRKRGAAAVAQLAAGVVALGLASGVAVAVVALHRHYATDAVGGAAVAIAVVLLGAVTVDTVAERRR